MDIKELARRGAQIRLHELQQEMDEIRRAFPELYGQRSRRGGRQTTASASMEVGETARSESVQTRARKPMTAAQRKAVGERMKKYWAARRKAEKKG